jgi:predicted nucleic acid-binding protein
VRLVVDANVAIKWFVPEPLRPEARRLLGGAHLLTAPNFILIECGSIIWKKCRRGEMTRPEGDTALAALRSGLLDLTPTAPLVGRALAIAHEIGHPFYDCIYLAAVEAAGDSVVTADRRFLAAVGGTRLADRVTWVADLP